MVVADLPLRLQDARDPLAVEVAGSSAPDEGVNAWSVRRRTLRDLAGWALNLPRRFLDFNTEFTLHLRAALTRVVLASFTRAATPAATLWPCPPPHPWSALGIPCADGRSGKRRTFAATRIGSIRLILLFSQLALGGCRVAPASALAGMPLNALQRSMAIR